MADYDDLMERMNDLLAGSTQDWSVSDDAMRWSPEPPQVEHPPLRWHHDDLAGRLVGHRASLNALAWPAGWTPIGYTTDTAVFHRDPPVTPLPGLPITTSACTVSIAVDIDDILAITHLQAMIAKMEEL